MDRRYLTNGHLKGGRIDNYRFISKNPQVTVQLEGRPTFGGPLLPQQVRGQVLHVIRGAVGSGGYADPAWSEVVARYDYEMGTESLGRTPGVLAESAVEFVVTHTDGLEVLDVIGLALLWAVTYSTSLDGAERHLMQISIHPEKAVDEVNRFFREAEVPYQFEDRQWVHVASGYVHTEIVRPALDVLARPGFEGALAEFQTALGHARDRKNKEAVTEATKAVESTMKCICSARGWSYPENATAKPLFDLLAAKGMVPAWMEHAIIPVATIRNKKSAHGQGPQPQPLPPYAADLAVNLAASSILALMAAYAT